MKRIGLALIILAVGACAPATAQNDTGRVQLRGLPIRLDEGWLGMGISCSHCTLSRPGRTGGRWEFSEPPTVFSVDPNGPADRAGLRTGDTLVSINGLTLVSREGGEAFGSVRSGQTVRIRYRRDGADAEVQLHVGTREVQPAEREMAERLRQMAREREIQAAQDRRSWEASQRTLERQREGLQRALERQQEYLQRAIERMREAQQGISDSERLGQLQRSLMMMDSAARRWRSAESLYAKVPPVAAMPAMPQIPSTAPLAAAAPAMPLAAMPSVAPLAPMTYAEHREFGPLRYSGRLGDAVIEARSPLSVTTTEVTDSEVVVTSRDLSVRIAIRPRAGAAPTAKPAPAPRAAPRPAPRPKRQAI